MNKLRSAAIGDYYKEYLFNNISELTDVGWVRDLASSKLHKQFLIEELSLVWELKDGRYYTVGYFDNNEGIGKLPVF